MVYGCGNTCIKFVFFFINLLICIFGGIVFAFSLWANLDQDFAVNIKQFVHNVDPGSDFQDLGKVSEDLGKVDTLRQAFMKSISHPETYFPSRFPLKLFYQFLQIHRKPCFSQTPGSVRHLIAFTKTFS